MNTQKIKIGDIVIVNSAYTQYFSYFNDMSKYIGQTSKVQDVNDYDYGSVCLIFQDGNTWWFPVWSLTKINNYSNVKNIDISNIISNKRLIVSDCMNTLNYELCIKDLRIICDLNVVDNTNRYDMNVLSGKYVNVSNSKHRIIKFYKRSIHHVFISVMFDGLEYYLPIHSLYCEIPSYKSKKIIYNV